MQLGLQLPHLSGMLVAERLLPCLQGMLAVVAGPWQYLWPANQASDLLHLPCSQKHLDTGLDDIPGMVLCLWQAAYVVKVWPVICALCVAAVPALLTCVMSCVPVCGGSPCSTHLVRGLLRGSLLIQLPLQALSLI